MQLRFDGEVIWWRGPAPFHFVALPEAEAARLRAVAAQVTYGWGCIPATVTLGGTTFTTSLFPKDGGYLVPVKAHARRAEEVELGDDVRLTVRIDGPDDEGADADGEDGDRDERATGRRPATEDSRSRTVAAHHDPAADDDFYDPADDPAVRRSDA